MILDGRDVIQLDYRSGVFPVELATSIKKRLPFLLFRLEAELPCWLDCEASVTGNGLVLIDFRDSVSSVLRIKLQIARSAVHTHRAIHYLYSDFESWSAFEQRVIDIYLSWARHSLWRT